MGPRFKVSSKRQLVFVRLTSPGTELTTSIFQVERSIQLSYASWCDYLVSYKTSFYTIFNKSKSDFTHGYTNMFLYEFAKSDL